MRKILTEYYNLVYKTTGVKLFSYISGLIYMSAASYIIVYGMVLLLKEWISPIGLLLILFRSPVSYVTPILFFGLIYWVTPTVQTVAKDAKKSSGYLTLLLFSVFGILLFVYINYADQLFT